MACRRGTSCANLDDVVVQPRWFGLGPNSRLVVSACLVNTVALSTEEMLSFGIGGLALRRIDSAR